MIGASQDSEANEHFANPFAYLEGFDTASIDSLTNIRITAENLYIQLRASTYNYSVREKAELNTATSEKQTVDILKAQLQGFAEKWDMAAHSFAQAEENRIRHSRTF